jgi:ABC-type transport system involved in multi-copper enzyme maturation permease subunit
MFVTLLAVTFGIALAVTFIVARIFQKSITGILDRIFIVEISRAWQRYMTFAIYVVGISGGVRVWELEKYITPRGDDAAVVLNSDRWVLEVYRTIIETLQSTAMLLLVFFVVAIVAYGIARAASRSGESQVANSSTTTGAGSPP